MVGRDLSDLISDEFSLLKKQLAQEVGGKGVSDDNIYQLSRKYNLNRDATVFLIKQIAKKPVITPPKVEPTTHVQQEEETNDTYELPVKESKVAPAKKKREKEKPIKSTKITRKLIQEANEFATKHSSVISYRLLLTAYLINKQANPNQIYTTLRYNDYPVITPKAFDLYARKIHPKASSCNVEPIMQYLGK